VIRAVVPGSCAAAALLCAAPSYATGFTDIGEDIALHERADVELHGYFRVRGEGLDNLDLDRGLTPSGQPLFPVSRSDPSAQWLTYADMRLRTDIAIYAPGGTVAVKARLDTLDNFPFGGSAEGIPSVSTSQGSPSDAIRVKRAYGEVLTPVGVLVAGRTGAHWGLGMLANSGDCLDCDSGDNADRIALVSPMLGHILAVAYDFSATGPFEPRRASNRVIAVEPTTNVRSVTAAILRWKDDEARERRKKAGKTTVEYGAYGAARWQKDDLSSAYLPTVQPFPVVSSQVMPRGYQAFAVDGWARVTTPWLHVEAEAAYLSASLDQSSLVPGVLLNDKVTSNQFGAAVETEAGPGDGLFGVGVDGGYASGDRSPGFHVSSAPSTVIAQPGDLDGAKQFTRFDHALDNFRFHPDYRIDRILFREIIGTVTGATYVRPHVRVRVARFGQAGRLEAQVAAVGSWAVFAEATPGQKHPLGVEVDPTLAYVTRDGFAAALEHAVLFPLSGLDNPTAHLDAKTAQLIRLRLAYVF
jgi:uncharacterized protein (TIGR04551 family)